jgi:hypothetical protein
MNNFIKHKEDCFTLENFLTEKECEKIISYLEYHVKTGKDKWNQISFYDSYAVGFWGSQFEEGHPEYWKDKNLKLFGLEEDYFLKLKQKIKNISEEALGIELKEVSYHAQKWLEGAFASFHSDNSDEYGNYTAFERSKYAVFIYLNDNFEGGYLNFEKYDIQIKPKTGLIAIFAGGHNNEHEVTKVIGNTRYTIGSFWDDASCEYTEERKKQWEQELSAVRAGQEVTYKKWAEDKERGIIPGYRGKNDK